MKKAERCKRRVEAVTQVKPDTDEAHDVTHHVDWVLKDFENEPVKIANFDAVVCDAVVRSVLECDQVPNEKDEEKRAVKNHEL